MHSKDYDILEQLISRSRLSTYKKQFHTTNPLTITSMYIWNAKLSENFYFLLQNLEVSLRNSIYEAFRQSFPNQSFFHLNEANIKKTYIKRLEYHSAACWKMICKVKANLEEENITLSDGKIIAELNFGFWTTLLRQKHYRNKMWRPILSTAFPYYPFSKSQSCDLRHISEKIDTIRLFRNRIFHYEPIFNHDNLHAIHRDMIEVLGWISPELQKLSLAFDEFDDIVYSKKKINKKLQRLYATNRYNKTHLMKKRNHQ